MVNTLVIIGRHKEEASFGDSLKDLMEKDRDPNILFYRVKNSYRNNGTSTQEEILTAYHEIYNAMQLYEPNITIDVHTGKGEDVWWDAELFTLSEYDKMTSLKRAETETFPVVEQGVHVPKNYPPNAKKFPLLTQKEFPYVVLEKYLIDGADRPQFIEQLQFTSDVIREISETYS